MPAFNQDFTRLESDTFQLQFLPTDGVVTPTTYAAWWGVSDTDSAVVSSAPLLQGWTNTMNGAIDLDAYNDTSGCSNGASVNQLEINPTTPEQASLVNVVIDGTNNRIRISIPVEKFELISPNGTYYHELVLMNVATIGSTVTAFQCSSYVAASGFITVADSIFTNRTYR
tara:strand:- start:352 stop:861 length:510 start_codon:yes stop_codon:yes gene_type:complete